MYVSLRKIPLMFLVVPNITHIVNPWKNCMEWFSILNELWMNCECVIFVLYWKSVETNIIHIDFYVSSLNIKALVHVAGISKLSGHNFSLWQTNNFLNENQKGRTD